MKEYKYTRTIMGLQVGFDYIRFFLINKKNEKKGIQYT